MSNLAKPKQFELPSQIDATINAIEYAMIDATTAIERMKRLKSTLANQMSELQAEADDLDWQTEEQFAEALAIKPTLLAKMRRDLNLPHCVVGREPRYTREQRRRVAEILEINNSHKGASRLKRAA